MSPQSSVRSSGTVAPIHLPFTVCALTKINFMSEEETEILSVLRLLIIPIIFSSTSCVQGSVPKHLIISFNPHNKAMVLA